MISENPLKEWLESIANDHTRELYRGRFQLFLSYVNPTLRNERLDLEQKTELERLMTKDLLETRKEQIKDPDKENEMGRFLKQFYVDMVKGKVQRVQRLMKGKKAKEVTRQLNWTYRPKAAQAYVNAVRQFFRYFGKAYEVDFQITETQLRPRVTKRKYEFSTEELQRVLAIASIRDKAIILLGAASGWSAGDVVILEKATVEKILNDSGKYYWFTKRVKTNSDMYLCLTSETREILTAYIKTLPQEEKWLFPGYNNKNEGHLGETQPDVILKDLCTKANITSKNAALQPIRFHGLRQYFSRKYGGRPEVKEFCMGHVPRYEGAYSVTEEEIWKDFETQEENLRIQQGPQIEKLKEQSEMIEALRARVRELEKETNRVALVEKQLSDLRKELHELAQFQRDGRKLLGPST